MAEDRRQHRGHFQFLCAWRYVQCTPNDALPCACELVEAGVSRPATLRWVCVDGRRLAPDAGRGSVDSGVLRAAGVAHLRIELAGDHAGCRLPAALIVAVENHVGADLRAYPARILVHVA